MLPLYSSSSIRRQPVVTPLLIAANLGVFVWMLVLAVGSGAGPLGAFVTANALVPARLVSGYANGEQWWTLLTHMFLHGGIAHLIGNLWFLWVFGRSVEDRLGPVPFLLFYLASGAAAAALQFIVDPGSVVPMIGASGAISGVLGAYFILMPGAWVVALVPWIVPILPLPAVVFLAGWFFLQAWNGIGALVTGAGGGVAWWAHAGGFLGGMALASWARNVRFVRRRG